MHVAHNAEHHLIQLNITLARAYKHTRDCTTYCQSAGSAKALLVPWLAFPKRKLPSESRTCTTQRQTGHAGEEINHDKWPTERMRYKYEVHASSPSIERAVDVCQYVRGSAFAYLGVGALGNTQNHKHAPVAFLRTTASSWCYATAPSLAASSSSSAGCLVQLRQPAVVRWAQKTVEMTSRGRSGEPPHK